MPVVSKPFRAISCAEFPERRIPWCAVAFARLRTCRNQPPFHDFLQETVFDEALAVNARQIVGLEYSSASLLKLFQQGKGFGQFFIWRGHALGLLQDEYKQIMLYIYKHIMLHKY